MPICMYESFEIVLLGDKKPFVKSDACNRSVLPMIQSNSFDIVIVLHLKVRRNEIFTYDEPKGQDY